MANNFVNGLDRMQWVPIAPTTNAHAAGMGFASDWRNDKSRYPYIGQLTSNTNISFYNVVTKGWMTNAFTALAGTFGAGAGAVFAPSRGSFGTVGSGCTATSIVLSTALPASVGINMLSQKGDNIGFKIRITSNASGSAGKTEEKFIVANTEGASPTIILESALTFIPLSGDSYELLSGRFFLLGAGALGAGSFKGLGVATNYLENLGYTNLPTTISTDYSALALDELYVPYDRQPGEGFIVGTSTYNNSLFFCLAATNIASGTITGQATGGDATVLANEYRNFQIRIVEDTAIPTAVGQRRIIASHTGGASPIYTLGSSWSVTPSATAKFVIEYPNLIILRSSATAVVYTYNYSGASITNGTNTIADDAWHTTYFANAPAVMAAGHLMIPSFGIEPDVGKNSRHSYIYSMRGGAVTMDLFNISGGTTGLWSSSIVYDGRVSPTTGSCVTYCPAGQEGRFAYVNVYTASAINQIYRFSVKSRTMMPFTPTDWIQAGTAAVGDRIAGYAIIKSDSEVYSGVVLVSHLSTNAFEIIIQA